MNQKLIIQTVPGKWAQSVITATGVMLNRYRVNSERTRIRPVDLPDEWQPVWNGMEQLFIEQGETDGERKCVLLDVEKRPLAFIPREDDPPDDGARYAAVITSYWVWSDGRMTDPSVMEVGAPAVLALFDYLMTPEAYNLQP